MTMKLSAKGVSKVWELIHKDTLKSALFSNTIEFDPDDFQDVVCLTVDEAKGILWDLRDLYKQTYGREWVKNEPWFDEFKKRINKAEIKHLKREIAQWKEEQARDNYYLQQFLKNVKQVEEEKQCKLMGKTLI